MNSLTSWYESIPILSGHGSIIASYKDLEYKLISYDTNLTLIHKTAKSSHMVRKNIKKELIIRGALFDDEIRRNKQ